jgi:hypothetical protein
MTTTTTRTWSANERTLVLDMHKRGFSPAMIATRIGKCTPQDVEFLILEQNKPVLETPGVPPPFPTMAVGDTAPRSADPLQTIVGQLMHQHNDVVHTVRGLGVLLAQNPTPEQLLELLRKFEDEWTRTPASVARLPLHVYVFDMLARMFIFVPRPTLKPITDAQPK